MTALTVALWATDPDYVATNPVVDLAFFAFGGVLVTGGFASQITRRPGIAGLQQAVLALTVLTAAGWLGGAWSRPPAGSASCSRRSPWWSSTPTVANCRAWGAAAAAP